MRFLFSALVLISQHFNLFSQSSVKDIKTHFGTVTPSGEMGFLTMHAYRELEIYPEKYSKDYEIVSFNLKVEGRIVKKTFASQSSVLTNDMIHSGMKGASPGDKFSFTDIKAKEKKTGKILNLPDLNIQVILGKKFQKDTVTLRSLDKRKMDTIIVEHCKGLAPHFGFIGPEGGSLSVLEASIQEAVILKSENCIQYHKILSYNFSVKSGGETKTFKHNDAWFSPDIKASVKNLKSGDIVFIDDVVVKGEYDQVIKKLPSTEVKIINTKSVSPTRKDTVWIEDPDTGELLPKVIESD